MRGSEIAKKMLEYLEKQDWPSTSEDVAKGVGISWNTAQIWLLRLSTENKVKFRKVGRQNQWWLEPKYRREIE